MGNGIVEYSGAAAPTYASCLSETELLFYDIFRNGFISVLFTWFDNRDILRQQFVGVRACLGCLTIGRTSFFGL